MYVCIFSQYPRARVSFWFARDRNANGQIWQTNSPTSHLHTDDRELGNNRKFPFLYVVPDCKIDLGNYIR